MADTPLEQGQALEDALRLKAPKDQGFPDDKEIGSFFQEAFRVANDTREPRERVWKACWSLYNGQYDWSGKADWQSKINIPRIRESVDKAAATFKRSLLRMKQFYQLEAETRLGIQMGLFTKSLIDYWLEHGDVQFITELTTAFKSGLLTGVAALKVWWRWQTERGPYVADRIEKIPGIDPLTGEPYTTEKPYKDLSVEDRVKGLLGVRAVDPFNLWRGPRDSYSIERAYVDLAYLRQLSKQGIYDNEAIDKLQGAGTAEGDKTDQQRRAKEGTHAAQSKYIKEIPIYHYWGPLYDEEGELLREAITFTVAGDEKDVVIRKPQANPFFHKKDPYVVGTPYVVPFALYNRGMAEDILGVATMITELSNLIVDGAQFDALKAFTVDKDLVQNPQDLMKGLYPGAVIFEKGLENPSDKEIVKPINTGKMPTEALATLAMLDREIQLSSDVSNPMPSKLASRTLGELQSNQAQNLQSLDDAARTLEETLIDPFLLRVAQTVYQYHVDYKLPRLVENFPDLAYWMDRMKAQERFAVMIGGSRFKARGISIFLEKQQQIQNAVQFIQLMMNIPGLLQRVNIDAWLEEILVGLGYNPNKILLKPATSPVAPPLVYQGNEPPGDNTGHTMSPMQEMNAQQGAAQGGATNNPSNNPALG